MKVYPFAVAYSADSIPRHPEYGYQNYLRHDSLQEDINVTEVGNIVNVISTKEPFDLDQIALLQEEGFEISLDGNGLVFISSPY